MKYVIEITEMLVNHVIVEAENKTDAEEKVWGIYLDGKVSLNYDDFCRTEIGCLREADEYDVKDYEEI